MKLQVVPMVVAALLTGCGATSVTSPPAASTGSPAGHPPSSTPLPASPATTASSTPGADTDAVRFTWSEVEFDGRVAAAAGDGARFVAVGSGSDGAASWTSTDGMHWEEQNVPEVSFGDIDVGVELTAGMGKLIRLGDTLYSFGGTQFMDAVLPTAWRWTDGGTWEVIESESEFFLGSVTSVTASDEALLAVTTSFSGGLRGTVSTWLWTAADSWVKTGLASSPEEDISVHDVAWNDDAYIAVGEVAESQQGSGPDAWPRAPSIWRSANGRDWTATQLPESASSVCSVTPLPTGGFVALGRTGDGAASWTSIDGGDWVEGTIGLPGGPGVRADEQGATPCNVVAFDGGLLASAPVEGATLTWTSRDGGNWSFDQRLDVFGVHATKMAAVGDHVFLFGNRVDPEGESGFRDVLLRGRGSPAT